MCVRYVYTSTKNNNLRKDRSNKIVVKKRYDEEIDEKISCFFPLKLKRERSGIQRTRVSRVHFKCRKTTQKQPLLVTFGGL